MDRPVRRPDESSRDYENRLHEEHYTLRAEVEKWRKNYETAEAEAFGLNAEVERLEGKWHEAEAQTQRQLEENRKGFTEREELRAEVERLEKEYEFLKRQYELVFRTDVKDLWATLELMRGQREDSLCALNTITEALRLLVRKSRGVQMKSGLDVSWDMLFEPEGQYQWFEPEIDSALAILEGGDDG